MKQLYLEQRVSLARKLLNERTIEFEALLPEHERLKFRQHVLDIMDILQGDSYGDTRKRLGLE